MNTCGWCGTHSVTWIMQCRACGGRMPPPVGMEYGEAPPPAPRAMPKGFAFRQKWSRNLSTLGGGGLFLIAVLFAVAFFKARSYGALAATIPFLLAGATIFWHGWRSATGVLNAYRYGAAVRGKVASVRLDTTQSINKRHPWELTYHFQAGEALVEGSITSFNSTLGTRSSGQPLWVLYVPDDPSQNTIYPSVR